jgi:DUF2075 family protein
VIVYQSTKAGFLNDAFKKDIEAVVLAAFKAQTGRSVSGAEVRSWKASLMEIAKVLNEDEIPGNCGVAIEYGIPQTAKRIDFLLSGKDGEQRDQLIIVELKQWEGVQKTDQDAVVIARFSGGPTRTSHPSYQAWSYGSLLKGFNEAIYEGDTGLQPCAYLHNYIDDGVLTDPFYAEYLALAPVFLKGEAERERLRAFIRRYVKYGDTAQLLYRLDHGRIRPSKGLVEALAGMLAGKQEFVLVDDQKVIYETALQLATKATSDSKQVVIIEGGPGTGKSVVAINLLVALNARRLLAKYVTRNRAPRQVFESVLTGTHKKTQISNLFGGAWDYIESRANVFDALIVDEAHRLNAKSGLYGNLGENQVQELIGASKCSVFFIDEDQRVTWKDIGETAEIERRAKAAGAKVTKLKLESQFRCSRSDGYLAWLDDTLEVRPTANPDLDRGGFDFRVFDSPEAVRQEIVRLNRAKNKARMVAGYCWDWKSKKDSSALDVVIPEFGFAMQWNLSKDGGLWMVAPDSVAEIGCIHTCQGLEVDYIGVIVGPDLIVREGRVQTRPEKRSKHDQSIKGYKALSKTQPEAAKARADLIIKNTYRTLMTRGMKGCYVYFTDRETQAYFQSRLQPLEKQVPVLARVAEEPGSYDAGPRGAA